MNIQNLTDTIMGLLAESELSSAECVQLVKDGIATAKIKPGMLLQPGHSNVFRVRSIGSTYRNVVLEDAGNKAAETMSLTAETLLRWREQYLHSQDENPAGTVLMEKSKC